MILLIGSIVIGITFVVLVSIVRSAYNGKDN